MILLVASDLADPRVRQGPGVEVDEARRIRGARLIVGTEAESRNVAKWVRR